MNLSLLKIKFLGMNLKAIENQKNLVYFSVESAEKGKIEIHEWVDCDGKIEKKDSHIRANEADQLEVFFDTQNSSKSDPISRIEETLSINCFYELLDKVVSDGSVRIFNLKTT